MIIRHTHIIENFLMGGSIVSSISYIATYLNPLLGAIWWSFPLSLIPSLWYMKQHDKSNSYLAKFSLSTTYALILLVISTLGLYYFFNNENYSFWVPVGKASLLWFVCSIVFYRAIKYFRLESRFI